MLVVAALCACNVLYVVCITIECGYMCIRVHAAGPWKFSKFCGVWHTPKNGPQPSPNKSWLSECKLSPLNCAPASSRDQIIGFSISYTTGKKGPNRKLRKLSAATEYRHQHRSFFFLFKADFFIQCALHSGKILHSQSWAELHVDPDRPHTGPFNIWLSINFVPKWKLYWPDWMHRMVWRMTQKCGFQFL